MTDAPPTATALVFLFSPTHSQRQWQAFVGYFQAHHYPCYACPVGGSLSAATPALATDVSPIVIACGADCRDALATMASPHPPRALALLFPTLAPVWRLAFSPPAAPAWLAYPAQKPGLRLAVRLVRGHVMPHPFRGIDAKLLDQPGWERVAFALRIWIETTFPPIP